MELRQYAAIVWRWKWLIILGTLSAAVGAFVASRLQTPVYEATTTLLISEAPTENTSDYTAILTSERLARTYAQMLTVRPVLEETVSRLHLNYNEDDYKALEGAINVQLVRDTQLITVSVEDVSSLRAASLANMLVTVFAERNEEIQQGRYGASKESLGHELTTMQELIAQTEAQIEALGSSLTNGERSQKAQLDANLVQYRQSYTNLLQSYESLRIAEARSVSNVVQVQAAAPQNDPVRPRTMMNTLLAAVVGGMLALGTIFLIEYLDTSVKTPEQAMAALGLPMLGLIGRIPDAEGNDPFVVRQPRAPISEAFRKLRNNIEFASVDRPVRTLLVTSPGPSEGKSTVASNVAAALGQAGKNVILLDADMRRPRVHKVMGVTNRVGLSDLFKRSPLDLEGALRGWKAPYLGLITTGPLPPNPAELLGSAKMDEILALLKKHADVVVIDAPPVSMVADAQVVSTKVDGVLLVLEPKKTPLEGAEQALNQLRMAGANVLGMVFNNVELERRGYYNGYYSGYYYYATEYAYEEDGAGGKRRKKGKRGRKGRAVVSG